MATESLNCPNCGASLEVGIEDGIKVCGYCQSTIRVTNTGSGKSMLTLESSQGSSLSQDTQEEIKQLLQAGKKIEAIKMYRAYTDVGLKEAKDAVEAIGESIGIVSSKKEISQRSCVLFWAGLVVGFLLWVAALILVINGVGIELQSMFGDSLSEMWIGIIQTATGFIYVFVSIALFMKLTPDPMKS